MNSSRKRSIDGLKRTAAMEEEDNNNNNNNNNNGSNSNQDRYPPAALEAAQQVRLEAIFHPKFDNEKSADEASTVRKAMIQKCQDGDGHLEVSVKHSGSLLLWSGGPHRYYSKNAADNIYTLVGETLLRQHFFRAYYHDDSSPPPEEQEERPPDETRMMVVMETASVSAGAKAYQDCSDYLEANRLTLSFEVVTSFLGDHGDRPRRDFLILTSVADRDRARFYGTAELMILAHRFRLPHNDCWIFQTTNAVHAVFDVYDHLRETGTAATVLPLLTDAADRYICSMYPHDVFQGDILEGLVIRFVPSSSSSPPLVAAPHTDPTERLADAALHLLRHVVPVSRPDAHQLIQQKNEGGAEGIDLRTLHRQNSASLESFEAALRQALGKPAKGGQVPCPPAMVAQWAAALQKSSSSGEDDHINDRKINAETQKIATLLINLTKLTNHVRFNLRDDRNILIIHVIHDQTFLSFERQRKPGELPLFRGFSVELLLSSSPIDGTTSTREPSASPRDVDMVANDNENEPPSAGEPLMLKMKFLPYMVRTFGCRNGLRTISQGGPPAFLAYVQNLLSKWGISQPARDKWMPFFRGWGSYAHACFDKQPIEAAKELPPLDSSNYLDHLLIFTKLYETGEFAVDDDRNDDGTSRFKGLVVVVSPVKQDAQDLAAFLSEQFGGVDCIANLDHPYLMDDVMAFGRICVPEVVRGPKALIQLAKKNSDRIALILYRCGEGEIDKLLLPNSEQKRLKGILGRWRSIQEIQKVASFDASALTTTTDEDGPMIGAQTFVASEELRNFVSLLKGRFVDRGMKKRPGALVFFAGIPGCGKSTIVDGVEDRLSAVLEDREITCLVGDKIKKKYWGAVKTKRLENTETILVADKNAPPAIWATVAEIASATQAIAIPVFHGAGALETTQVQGVRDPDGAIDPSVYHHYPFSLKYLAVCMSRVLDRKSGSHAGKLDLATPRACMIVVKLFSLYRNQKAEEVDSVVRDVMSSSNAVSPPAIVRLPFFQDGPVPDLPAELSDILQEALRCQYGSDRMKVDTDKGSDEYIGHLEKRLRFYVQKHQASLNNLTVQPSVSADALARDIASIMLTQSTTTAMLPIMPKRACDPIKIAAIDVEKSAVNGILEKIAGNPSFDAMVSQICKGRNLSDVLKDSSVSMSDRFTINTHVTLAHVKDMGAYGLKSTFGPFVGQSVDLVATGVLWNDRVMALAVEFAAGTTVPTEHVSFPHITVWVADGAKAFESKDLLKLWQENKAEKLDFGPMPHSLSGTVSFWLNDKSSLS